MQQFHAKGSERVLHFQFNFQNIITKLGGDYCSNIALFCVLRGDEDRLQ